MVMILLLTVHSLLLYASTQADDINIGNSDYSLFFNESGNCIDKTWNIVVDDTVGVGFNITIEDLQLDSDQEAYLALSAEPDMLGTNSSVVYLSGTLSSQKLALPLLQKMYMKLSRKSPCSPTDKFNVLLVHLEKAVPFIPPAPPNPRPPEGIPTDIAVHFSGKSIDDFKQSVPQILSIIKSGTQKYCLGHGMKCNLTKPADETVFLNDIQACPDFWDNHENCTQAWLAVYVSNPKQEYELTPDHLDELWSEMTSDKNPFSTIGLKPYEYPNVSVEILWWMLWILIAVIIAGGAAFILWRLEAVQLEQRELLAYEEQEKKHHEIFDGIDLRRPLPMRPAKHQKIPDFMDSGAADDSSIASAVPQKPNRFFSFNKFPTLIGESTTASTESKDNDNPSTKFNDQVEPHDFIAHVNGFNEDEEDEILFQRITS